MSHDNTITRLEGFLDCVFNELNMAGIKDKPSNQPASVLEEDSSTNTDQHSKEAIISEQGHDAVQSTPLQPTLTDYLNSTPDSAAVNLDSPWLFKELVRRVKKRKTISPIKSGETDISLNDDQATIADAVYNVLITDISELMSDIKSRIKDEIKHTLREEIEASYQSEEIASLQDEVKKLKEQVEVSIGRITRLEKDREDLKEDVLQLEARMMRDNLVFYNINEADDEGFDCTDTLVKFLREEMKISQTNLESIDFDRVHRMGKKFRGSKRPIVAKFNPSSGKQLVKDHIKNLNKVKKFGVSDQLPRELDERKKKLMPKFKEAREAKNKPRWQKDKLVVGDKVIKAHKDTVVDINTDTTEIAAKLKVHHAPPKTHDGSTFKGHNVMVQSQDDIIPALHAIYKDDRVARATHNIYAYRLKNGLEHFEDDGEWGAGRVLLKVLQDNDVTDKLVCVTRWYGGKNLGKARFDHIRDAAKTTLQIPLS